MIIVRDKRHSIHWNVGLFSGKSKKKKKKIKKKKKNKTLSSAEIYTKHA